VRAGEAEDALLIEKPVKNRMQDELAEFLANESVVEAEEEMPMRINNTLSIITSTENGPVERMSIPVLVKQKKIFYADCDENTEENLGRELFTK